ncbi:MAG: ZIP family metal transporter, partial [Limnoraphis robusta]
MLDFIKDIPTVYLGLIGSFIAGMGTGVGAIPVLVIRKISQRVQGAMLGFGAGVMLAATSFSLVVPSLEAATQQTNSNIFSALIVVIGILLGGLFLWCSHQYFPHEHFIKGPEGNYQNLKRIWLFVIAIAIHNFPEGLAVGVGF